MAERAASRASIRMKRRRQRVRRQSILIPIMVIGALLILGAGWWLSKGREAAEATIAFTPEDITYESPLHAVHEMGGGPPIPFLPRGGPQPSIAVNQRYYDFGSLGPNDVVTRQFIIANNGEAPLTISRAYTTCGCTTADFTSAVIPPGKISIMTLRFDAGFHDVRGETVRRGVIIENNDPDRSTVEIWTQASIRSTP